MASIGSVDHVIDGVYIGGFRATKCTAELRQAGVTSVLKLYESAFWKGDFTTQAVVEASTPHRDWPEDFLVCENVLQDGEPIAPPVLRRGVDFVKTQVAADKPVLVVCGAGISRSSTFVLAYLIERGFKLPDAFALLVKQHQAADPHPEMWNSLFEYYRLNYDLEDVWDWYEEHKR
jgi:hypothetical protein